MVNGGYPDGPEMADAIGRTPDSWLWRVFWFVFVFVLLWPPLVAIVAVPPMFGLAIPADVSGAVRDFFLALAAAYMVGANPAAVAGAALGVKEVRFGGAGWRFALAIGVGAGIGCLLIIEKVLDADRDWKFELGFCVVAMFATLVCRSVVKTWVLARPRVSRIKP
jgi:hypothetical protein